MASKAFEARNGSSNEANRRIDNEIEVRVKYCALQGRSAIDRRIKELDNEWDMERTMAVNAGTLALSGVVLAALHSKKWLILPGVVTAILIQQAVQGWTPVNEFFRRMGVRNSREIERERTALKALRGDFKDIDDEDDDMERGDMAIKAAQR